MADDTNSPATPASRRGGGMPGTAKGAGTRPGPKTDAPKAAADRGRVARNAKNLLAIPLTRMPLGHYIPTPADLSRFRLWIPTNTGGVLTIQFYSGTGTADLRRPFRKILKPAANEIVYEVKPGEFGEYFTVVNSKAGDQVLCMFVQTGFSRDGLGKSDAPLIPWNFWYWPTANSAANPFSKNAADVMARYAKVFGHDAEACRAAELADHATKAPATGAYDWQGHCHNAAPASAFFEEPALVTYKGETFTEEEMKYLGAEFFGNFGKFEGTVWELKRGPSKPGGSSARWYLPAYFKPGNTVKDRATLVDGLKKEFQGDKSLDDPELIKFAEQLADVYVGALGGSHAEGEKKFEKLMDQWLGELAAEFYQALIDNMLVKKHPLLSNMRSYRDTGGPDQVWNQAFFWYQAWYLEFTPPGGSPGDENDMVVVCELRANYDHWNNGNPSGLPAQVSGDDVKPTDGNSLVFHNLWRIQFDGSGKIIIEDARNGWLSLLNSDDKDLFAPTDLLTLGKARTDRRSGDKFSLGNKYLSTDVVDAGLLKIHKRFQ